MRNGVIADTLRKVGMPYKVIFGLQVPQIAEIARRNGQSMELAEELWADREVRESRILASYIFPPAEVTEDKALELMRDTRTREEADMLGFRLLKRLPFAPAVASALEADATPESRYAAEAIRRHIE